MYKSNEDPLCYVELLRNTSFAQTLEYLLANNATFIRNAPHTLFIQAASLAEKDVNIN